jgi:2-amino-4-hydroxy-6-hydroxymethyldihydropteridine diphosphokinase
MVDKHIVYLALGTNLGDREDNLKKALQALPPQIEVSAVSRLYETAPAYVVDQPAFLNIVIKGQTDLSPTDLLAYLKLLETQIGREKTMRYGPRKIDLDIIFYDDLIVDLPHLQIPHPRMSERGFVLYPLADIASDVVHPVLKQTNKELLANLSSDNGVLTASDWQPLI